MKRLSGIVSLMCLCVAAPAVADWASTSYVNTMQTLVQNKIDSKVKNSDYTTNRVLQTDSSGNVIADTVGTGLLANNSIQEMHLANGSVTNADLAGMLDILKLNMGDLPTSGKHMMIWNPVTSKYVFEPFVDGNGVLQCDARAGMYDIGFEQCVDASPNGSGYGYWHFDGSKSNTDTYGLTAAGQWGTTLYTGDKITGIASCNNTPGATQGEVTTEEFNNTADGQSCWCKMTEPSASRWVFAYNSDSARTCALICANDCGNFVRVLSDFRSGVFGSVVSESSEYTFLEYIESTGTQYIDTGVVPMTNIAVDMDIKFAQGTFQTTGGTFLSGTESGSTSDFKANFGGNSDQSRVIFFWAHPYANGAGRVTNISSISDNILFQRNRLYMTGTTVTYGNLSRDISPRGPAGTTTSLVIFGGNNSGVVTPFKAYPGMYVYSLKIYDGEAVIRDMVPAKRNSDGAIGMYDQANDTFYGNSGSGTFTAGPEI